MDLELKLYELLGIKKFKKFVLKIKYLVLSPLFKNLSKEERKKEIYNSKDNYNIGTTKDLEDLKKFKKKIYMNAIVHIVGTFIGIIACVDSVAIPHQLLSIVTLIVSLSCVTLNTYCVMLQRYNLIRINKVIKKCNLKYEKQKNKVKEELKLEDLKLYNHTYKIINKNKKENNIELDKIIENLTLEELKTYKEYLIICQKIRDDIHYDTTLNEYDINIPISVITKNKKQKILKIELKNINKGK